MSEANHDLIRLLDKPGAISNSAFYKEISFLEKGEGSAFKKNAPTSRRTGPLTCKQALN